VFRRDFSSASSKVHLLEVDEHLMAELEKNDGRFVLSIIIVAFIYLVSPELVSALLCQRKFERAFIIISVNNEFLLSGSERAL
jgi:hypothetical protein